MLFFIVSIIVLNIICFLVPRRLSWIEILASTWFGLYFEAIVNIFLDLKYDLYGYFHKGVDWASLFPLFGVFPAFNYLILNFYPRNKGSIQTIVYLLVWTAISVIYETVSIMTGGFYYNGWTWWYSAIAYPFVILILWYNLELIRWVVKKSRTTD